MKGMTCLKFVSSQDLKAIFPLERGEGFRSIIQDAATLSPCKISLDWLNVEQ